MAAFGALLVATVGAFFVTQHLKVTTPLIAGQPSPYPSAINPVDGRTCKGVNHRFMMISFYLLYRSDDVDVYIVDSAGSVIRTLATGRHMRRDVRIPDGMFVWNGREDNGTLAPDGTYYVKVALIHQGRSVLISNNSGPEPVIVKTAAPHPAVTSVSPQLIPQGNRPVVIHYTGNEGRGLIVRVYRTDLPGGPRLVKSTFSPPDASNTATWNGLIQHRPAPAGTYLMGLDVTDAACNAGHFPVVLPPPPGTTPHAGVTVRYLAAEPPLDPVPAGSRALVYVDSRQRAYRWQLLRAGASKPLVHGAGSSFALRLGLPGPSADLYELALSSGAHTTEVPLIASTSSGHPRVLVVLPALTWQGQNPGDDDGDGLPDTLDAGGPIELARPLAVGLPNGFGDEAALLAYLDKTRHAYDLTTDEGLIDGVGPRLAGHTAVVLAGSERWLPASLARALRGYVQAGGRVLSLGVDSMLRSVTISGYRALNPSAAAAADALGARPGRLVAQKPSDLITQISDGLGIFSGTSGVLQGFSSYQPFTLAVRGARLASAAGATTTAPSIIGYRLGRGVVVDFGLPGFGGTLSRNVGARELLDRTWSVLSSIRPVG